MAPVNVIIQIAQRYLNILAYSRKPSFSVFSFQNQVLDIEKKEKNQLEFIICFGFLALWLQ